MAEPVQYPLYGITVSAYELPASQSETVYLSDVDRDLQQIATTVTGRAVFAKIKAHGQVLVAPYTRQFSSQAGTCNAVETPPVSKGSKVDQVRFTHAVFAAGSPCSRGPGDQYPDSVLLHELVHAGRSLGGDAKTVPLTGALAGYEFEEEFFAILVQNIYLSETKRAYKTGLRKDHSSAVMDSDDYDPKYFLSNPENFRLVEKYCGQHPNIAPMLAKAPADFNPIKVYYDWGEEYPSYPIIPASFWKGSS